MKQICLSLALLGLVATTSEAQQIVPRPVPQSGPRPVPHRLKISSFGVWVRTVGPNGQPAYRYTYSGHADGMGPPAIYSYGAEHMTQDNGPNTLNGPWWH